VFASVYQKMVGPTHPDRVTTELNGTAYNYKLRRSNDGEYQAQISLEIPDQSVNAKIHYKSYPVIEGEEYTTIEFSRDGDFLKAELPHQSAAGKLMYYIEFVTEGGSVLVKEKAPIVLRYRDPVPDWVLLPHIFFIFLAMLFSNVAGIKALASSVDYKKFALYTLVALIIGGFIFGPIMQKYAFGEYWTGFPFGIDLTDNKTLIALIAWLIAAWLGSRKEDSRLAFIIAAVVTIGVFLIPHSVLGSELDRESGQVITGMIGIMF
jgi:hypothetical protein